MVDALSDSALWGKAISNRTQKEMVAKELAKRLKSFDIVGVGSGSTSYLTLRALAERRDREKLHFSAITTSLEMELVCSALHVPTTTLIAASPDWCFDGADEVDPKDNLIKGRGGAFFREKLVMTASPERFIVIDGSKRVKKLGTKFAVPVEVHPNAIHITRDALEKLNEVASISIRQGVAKDGPVITENGNLIFDVRFRNINDDMEKLLASMVGVIDSGLFMGFKPTILSSN